MSCLGSQGGLRAFGIVDAMEVARANGNARRKRMHTASASAMPIGGSSRGAADRCRGWDYRLFEFTLDFGEGIVRGPGCGGG